MTEAMTQLQNIRSRIESLQRDCSNATTVAACQAAIYSLSGLITALLRAIEVLEERTR